MWLPATVAKAKLATVTFEALATCALLKAAVVRLLKVRLSPDTRPVIDRFARPTVAFAVPS